MTERERVKAIRRNVSDVINKAVARVTDYLFGENQSDDEFAKRVAALRSKINGQFGVKGVSEITTTEEAERYLQLAVKMCDTYVSDFGA